MNGTGEDKSMVIEPMTLDVAKVIQQWTYEEPYSLYSFGEEDNVISEFMNGSYYYVMDKKEKLIGYFCFGKSAQVPAGYKVNAYEDHLLDIGLGMSPDETGKGKGKIFLQEGVDFGTKKYKMIGCRLTVAAFNKRAKKVYEREGFEYQQTFVNATDRSKISFEVMVRKI